MNRQQARIERLRKILSESSRLARFDVNMVGRKSMIVAETGESVFNATYVIAWVGPRGGVRVEQYRFGVTGHCPEMARTLERRVRI